MICAFSNIISNPDILGGKPCIKGTRISVELIMDWLETGGNIQTIAAKHPLLTTENVEEAINYGINSLKFDKVFKNISLYLASF